jgi:hypothetical protein
MPYLGELQAAPYTVVVKGETKVSLTIFNIRRDHISEVENVTLDPLADPTQNGSATTTRTIGNVGRIVISASVMSATGTLTLTQGNSTFLVVMAPDATVTFDVV